MNAQSPSLSRHTKAVAILWLIVLAGVWISERGFLPWTRIFEEAGKRTWWQGKTFEEINHDFEANLKSFQRVRPYYNWTKFWAFGASNNTVARGKKGWMFYPEHLQAPSRDLSLAQTYLDLFHEINLSMKAKGFELWLVPVPEKGMIYPEYLPGGQKNVQARLERLQTFMAAAQKRRIKVVDIVTPFLAEADAGPRLFSLDDTHWSEAGAQRAAEICAASVKATVLPSPTPLTFRETPIQRTADLASMLNFPQAVLLERHQVQLSLVQAQSRQAPQTIWFGTSFSYGFSMAHRFAKVTQSLTANEATNGMLLSDFFPALLAWLEHPGNAAPGTHVMVEFPYRHLNDRKNLAEIKQQMEWRRQFSKLQPQLMIDPRTLPTQNLIVDTQWQPQNTDPMIFLDSTLFQAMEKPLFLRVRLRTQSPAETPPYLKVYYDLGNGFSEKQTTSLALSRTSSWQSHWIPIPFDRKLPQRIRLDALNRQQNFQLDLLAVY